MIILLLAAAGVAWWFWGRHLARHELVAIASALGGLYLLFRGTWAVALPMFLPAVWLFVQKGGAGLAAEPPEAPRGARIDMDRDEARRILGVAADADPEAIRAAHRRLVARVHPDQGGSAELAGRVNAARDILLAEPQKR